MGLVHVTNLGTCFLLHIEARSIAEAWEEAVIHTYTYGIDIESEWSVKRRHVRAIIAVTDPMSLEMLHRGNTAVGAGCIFTYVAGVLLGKYDHLVEKTIHYTYHQRLRKYPYGSLRIDQILYVIDKLRKAPYTTRAQAITWVPEKDYQTDSPPCLQRVWFQVIDGRLEMHVSFRSEDVWNAMLQNMIAMHYLQRFIAKRLGTTVGPIVWFVDDLHIYENDLGRVKGFVTRVTRDHANGKAQQNYWSVRDYLEYVTKVLRRDEEVRAWREVEDFVESKQNQ